jgi:hypothetical protein
MVLRSTKPWRESLPRLPAPDCATRRPSTSTRVEPEPSPRRLTPETPVWAGGELDEPFTKLNAGLVVSVGAHSAYFRLFQAHDANLIVPLTLLTPLLTIAFGTWLTGDEIGWPLIVGGGLAIIGVAIIVIRPSRNIFKPLLVRPRL